MFSSKIISKYACFTLGTVGNVNLLSRTDLNKRKYLVFCHIPTLGNKPWGQIVVPVKLLVGKV